MKLYSLKQEFRKMISNIRNLGQYFWLRMKNINYDINYLKKITQLNDAKKLWPSLKTEKKYLMQNIDKNAIELYRTIFPTLVKSKIAMADLICDHEFELFGHRIQQSLMKKDIYTPIDWHSDFISGYSWPRNRFFKWIKYGHIENADVVVAWEFSRFQDRMMLAQAYLLTNYHKYAIEFENQVLDWISNNPYEFGVNWASNMDVAIRAVNWLIIKELFEINYEFKNEFLIKFFGSLYDHGKHIRKNLHKVYNITSNHYLSQIVSLIFISLYCPFFKQSGEWLHFALDELENEMTKQVYPDGCDYEASTSYHVLVLEILFYGYILCERAGIKLSSAFGYKLKKMFEALSFWLKPDGTSPQVGDNDDGRFLKFSKRSPLDHNYLLSLAVIQFDEENLKINNLIFAEESFWIYGPTAKNLWDNLHFRDQEKKIKLFPNAGWYVIKYQKDYCFISCGPNGKAGLGGHAHNDKLSFELILNGQNTIIDPGAGVYSSNPHIRNKFRSTSYHNTIAVDQVEQNELSSQLFYLPDRVSIIFTDLIDKQEKIAFEGRIEYQNITHERKVIFDKEKEIWHIMDRIYSSRIITAKLLFHLAPGLELVGNKICHSISRQNLAIIETKGYELKWGQYSYSPGYHCMIPAFYIYADIFDQNKDLTINTYIYKPYE